MLEGNNDGFKSQYTYDDYPGRQLSPLTTQIPLFSQCPILSFL